MSRKRSISSILDDDYEESSSSQTSNTSSRRRRNRSIASLIDEESISTSRPLTSRNTRSRFQDSQSSISDTFYQFGIQEETGEPSTSTSARQNIEFGKSLKSSPPISVKTNFINFIKASVADSVMLNLVRNDMIQINIHKNRSSSIDSVLGGSRNGS